MSNFTCKLSGWHVEERLLPQIPLCMCTISGRVLKGGGREKIVLDLIAPKCCYSSVEHNCFILTTGFKTKDRNLPSNFTSCFWVWLVMMSLGKQDLI